MASDPHFGFAALLADALVTLRDVDAEDAARADDPVERLAVAAAHRVVAETGRPFPVGGAAAYQLSEATVERARPTVDLRYPATAKVASST